MKFEPRPYQHLMVDHILQNPRCALWGPMGFGKTSAALSALQTIALLEDNKTLVIAPLRVAKSVWPDEIQKWDNFGDLSVSPIIGTEEERLFSLNKKADMHTINYENLPWLAEQIGDDWRWDTVIADESTRLKHFRLPGGKPSKSNVVVIKKGKRATRARTLGKYAVKKGKRFIELTGTPAPNGLIDLWGQLWFLDFGERLGRTFTAFQQRWFFRYGQFTKLIPFPNAQNEIHARIKDICLALKVEDWFDVRKPIITDVPVVLPEKAMNMYKQMEKMMYLEIENTEVEAFNAASKTLKCLQLANGAIYTNDKQEWVVVHDEKLNALDSIIEESAGAPILVAHHFKSDLARLKKRFPQGIELTSDPLIVRTWNEGKIPLLFAHPASAGHGLNLQYGGNIIVFFGHWWDLEQYQQIYERIGPVRQMQAGFKRPVYIYNIRAVKTVDDLVIKSRTDKRKVQDLLLEAARKK